MKTITIRQTGRACVVLCGDSIVFGGGRVAAKKFAMTLHASTCYAVYNVKDGGQNRIGAARKSVVKQQGRQMKNVAVVDFPLDSVRPPCP